MRQKAFDISSVFVLSVLATIITIVVRSNVLVSVLLFFGLPSAYLALRNPRILNKGLVFALLLSVPLSFFVDTLAAINGSWIVPNSVFPFRIFGVATIEVYLFGLLWVLYAVLFYEHFFENGQTGGVMSARIMYLACLCFTLPLYVIAGLLFDNSLLYIPYFYALVGIALVVIPLVVFLSLYPFFWRRFLLTGLHFFFLLFLFEIAALATGQWTFPGKDFIGFVRVFGYQFPVEELIVWMCLATAALLAYYEYFADDRSLGT